MWNARIQFLPGIRVLVRDAFIADSASMRGAIFGLVPVVNAQPSPDLSSGALQRYVGECVWHMVPQPWEARLVAFRKQSGMTVPDRANAVWHLPGGDFEYWRGSPEAIVYEFGK